MFRKLFKKETKTVKKSKSSQSKNSVGSWHTLVLQLNWQRYQKIWTESWRIRHLNFRIRVDNQPLICYTKDTVRQRGKEGAKDNDTE